MSTLTITDFLEARIAEDEAAASALLKDLEGEVAESYADAVDERGPFTPQRLLGAKMWSQFAGQSKWRNFAAGQNIATLANPSRVLAECAAKRAIIGLADQVETMDYQITNEWGGGLEGTGDNILKALAAVYSWHKDYDSGWAL